MPRCDAKETSDNHTLASPVCEKNTIVESSKERISCKEQQVLAIKELFANEISEKSNLLWRVRPKIMTFYNS